MSISFYLRLLRRQWRSGVLRLLCVAITIASAAIFSVSLISDRLDRLFQRQSNEILAADLVLKSSSSPITEPQQQLLANYPALRQAQMMNFSTMFSVQDRTLLGTVKAVTGNYPLRGRLQLSDELYGLPQVATGAPLPGEVWAEERILHELNIDIGDYLRIGSRSFLLGRVLVFEPDRGDNFYSFVPRVMMNWDDIASTGILRPGSRVNYRYLFAGEDAEIQTLREELQQGLQPNQQFITIEQASRTLSTNLEKAYGFLPYCHPDCGIIWCDSYCPGQFSVCTRDDPAICIITLPGFIRQAFVSGDSTAVLVLYLVVCSGRCHNRCGDTLVYFAKSGAIFTGGFACGRNDAAVTEFCYGSHRITCFCITLSQCSITGAVSSVGDRSTIPAA